MTKDDINLSIHYNIIEFYNNAILGKDTEIISGKFDFKINRSNNPLLDWKDWARKVLWYGHRSGDYLYEVTPQKKDLFNQN